MVLMSGGQSFLGVNSFHYVDIKEMKQNKKSSWAPNIFLCLNLILGEAHKFSVVQGNEVFC